MSTDRHGQRRLHRPAAPLLRAAESPDAPSAELDGANGMPTEAGGALPEDSDADPDADVLGLLAQGLLSTRKVDGQEENKEIDRPWTKNVRLLTVM